MSEIIFTPQEDSFIIEAEGKKLRVSYEKFCGEHQDAMAFCKAHNGGDETVTNLRLISKYRDEINAKLKELGREIIDGWYWSKELSWRYDDCAFVVGTNYGGVDLESRNYLNYARAVSAL